MYLQFKFLKTCKGKYEKAENKAFLNGLHKSISNRQTVLLVNKNLDLYVLV